MTTLNDGRVLTFSRASGGSISDCSAIVLAVDELEGFQADDVFSWLVERDPRGDDVDENITRKVRQYYRDVWRSPDRTTFVVVGGRGKGMLRVQGHQVDRIAVPFLPMDIGGVDTGEPFVCGSRGVDLPVLGRWNGRGFDVTDAPDYIQALAGPRADHFYAVGRNGLLAHWDGLAWRRFLAASSTSIAGLTVVDADTAYASSWSGELYELSPHGCSLVAQHKTPLFDVGHCDGGVFVATMRAFDDDAGLTGLLRLEGTKLVPVKCEGAPRTLDSRGGSLLITTTERLLETRDGKSMRALELRDVVAPILDAELDEPI